MTLDEIDRIADLFASVGARIPVCPHEWREMMATRIGKAVVKDGKIKPIITQSVSRKIGAKKKADRIENALRANASKRKKPA